MAFLAACTRCGACIDVCPPHAIVNVRPDGGLAAGTPYIDPANQPCMACADHALCGRLPHARRSPFPIERLGRLPARPSWSCYPERCVTFRGTPCRVCADACPVGEAALTIDEAGHPVYPPRRLRRLRSLRPRLRHQPSSFELSYVED